MLPSGAHLSKKYNEVGARRLLREIQRSLMMVRRPSACCGRVCGKIPPPYATGMTFCRSAMSVSARNITTTTFAVWINTFRTIFSIRHHHLQSQ